MDDNLRIWRNFQLGQLMDLTMLDTRQYDRSITDLYWNTDYIHAISNDAGRSMMGSRQENWFYGTLIQSQARNAAWRVIGSQTVFSRVNESISYGNVNPLDYDAWDGYQANRNRTFNVLVTNNITNNIVLSGDSHANWVSDLVWFDHSDYDPATGAGSLGVEFAGTAVTSQSPYGQNLSLAQSVNYSTSLIADNQELQWSEVYYRGYFELRVSKDQVDAEYFGMPTVINRNPHEISLANFTVMKDANALLRVNGTTAMGGAVENGAVKFGKTVQTNITNSTDTGLYYISHDNQEDL
jgi:alkaline phosphatase D